MQLDRTRIAIRERSYLEIMDLALQVIRRHFIAWFVLAALGGTAAIALNMWIFPAEELAEVYGEEAWVTLWGYTIVAGFLTMFEMPLVAAPLTLFLGQALFVERPRAGTIAVDGLKSLPQLIFLQVIGRALVSVFCLTAVLPYIMWPYLSEVVLLERNPLFGRKRQVPTTLSRSGHLHSRNVGELTGRWLAALAIGALLVPAIWLGLWIGVSLATGVRAISVWQAVLLVHVALWIVISYFVVVRFLSYLDLRIRTEGWEIELAMRAEGGRLARQLA